MYFNVKREDGQYRLSDFAFENLVIRKKKDGFDREAVKNFSQKNVYVECVEEGEGE